LENIQKIINDYALNYVQLHGHESPDMVQKIKTNASVGVIKVIRVAEEVDWKEFEPFEKWVDLFLFDTSTKDFGGSGIKFNWAILENYPFQKEFLLSGGVDEESLETISALATKVPQLAGVDINSRFELSPGVKDIRKVSNFVKEVRNTMV
jgi:phosphoribosylanthranilate isomerase